MGRKKRKKHFQKPKIINSKYFYLLVVIACIFIVADIVVLYHFSNKSSEYIYADFIRIQMTLEVVPIIITEVSFLIAVLVFFKKMDADCILDSIVIIAFGFLIITGVASIEITSMYYKDIAQEDYVTYVGEFEKDHTRDQLYLNDKKSRCLKNADKTFLQKGEYSGTVLYSKRSKLVLAYTLDTGETASVAAQSD